MIILIIKYRKKIKKYIKMLFHGILYILREVLIDLIVEFFKNLLG